MEWLLRKVSITNPISRQTSVGLRGLSQGDVVEVGLVLVTAIVNPVQANFFDRGLHEFSKALYYCDDDTPPSRKEGSELAPS